MVKHVRQPCISPKAAQGENVGPAFSCSAHASDEASARRGGAGPGPLRPFGLLTVGMVVALLTACAAIPSDDTDGAPSARRNEHATHDRKAAPGSEVPLQSTRWHLVSIAGGRHAPSNDSRPSLVLDEDGKAVTGFAGCNSFFGAYGLDGASISFGRFGVTKRYCNQAAMALENQYLAALAATASLRQQGRSLSLLDAKGAMLLHFEAGPAYASVDTEVEAGSLR
ncbi:MAG: META domain-containing protein [Lautropia sp.]|nr:META domain-containing protein [Lautropia sp.]